MTCAKLETLLVPYLDGKASVQERALVDTHLAECSACQARREGWLAVSLALESWEAPAPSPWFGARLRQRIAAADEVPGRGGWLAALSPSFPLSLAVLLFLAALLVWSDGSNQALPRSEERRVGKECRL